MGLGNYWLAQYVENESQFLSIFCQRIKDIYKQDWAAEVKNTSSNRLYKHVKEEFKFEEYLDFLNLDAHRICLTQMRLSSHAFMIERGRWGRKKVEYSERKCGECGTIEDEYHCLMECPRYKNQRVDCLNELMGERKIKSMFHFVKLLQCKKEEECKKLALLCFRIMKEYKRMM